MAFLLENRRIPCCFFIENRGTACIIEATAYCQGNQNIGQREPNTRTERPKTGTDRQCCRSFPYKNKLEREKC